MTQESVKKGMSRKLMLLGLVLVVALGAVFVLFTEKADAGARRMKLILQVDNVKLEILPAKKPLLHITASGTVSSTGWTAPELVPTDEDCPKSFKCFEFRAKPPTGISKPVLTPITAHYTLDDWQHVKMIKITSKSNAVTKPVESSDELRASQRQEYYGPVFLTQYSVDKGASYFWVDDPNKLPEKAVAARVPLDKTALTNLMVSAWQTGKKVMVAPGHRWWLPGGKLAWTIWAAKIVN